MKGNDPQRVLLSIGSNIGDKQKNIEDAVRMIKEIDGVSDIRLSGLYETEPVGYEDQDYFYNICLMCDYTGDPHTLLDAVHDVENRLKRKRTIRWGPRTIDIDIILFGSMVLDDEDLQIPHPRYTERAFVLIPMSDLMDPEVDIPEDKSVKQVPWAFEV